MNADLPPQENAGHQDASPDSPLTSVRHELHGSIAHILGFSEIWIEELHESNSDTLKAGFNSIFRTATRMMAQVNEGLPQLKGRLAELAAFQRQLCEKASEIVDVTEELA